MRTSGAASPDPLAPLLAGEWPDPDGGPPIGVPVRSIVIEPSLAGREADCVAALALGRRLAVVSDPATRRVMGERVERALAAIGQVTPVVLGDAPHADAETVEAVRRACTAADALVAVGSGTINDLCKYAAARDGKPYAAFATAPSMNGYTSVNAAITVGGHKQTLVAAAPAGVFVDLQVLATAPVRMIRAGLGDSLCRSTAQIDWMLSHRLLGTPYRRAPFALLAADEAALFDAGEALVGGNLDAMRTLVRTLVLSGLGMTICGGSFPASQGEHLISHYVDMFAPAGRASFLHGEQIGVATLTMARIQDVLVASPVPPRLEGPAITALELQHRLGREIGASCWPAFETKRAAAARAVQSHERFVASWQCFREEARSVIVPARRIAAALARAGCPTEPEQIGVPRAFYATAVRDARYLRDRYTFLDLADDAGRLAELASS